MQHFCLERWPNRRILEIATVDAGKTRQVDADPGSVLPKLEDVAFDRCAGSMKMHEEVHSSIDRLAGFRHVEGSGLEVDCGESCFHHENF